MAGNLTNMIASIFSGSAVTADPYYEYTTLLLPGSGTNGAQNNTFLDGSTNNFTITRNGNTTQGTFSPFSQTGWGNYFDGTNAYLTSSHPALNATFTIEAWVYRTSGSALQSVVFLNSGGVSGVIVYIDASNYLVCTDGSTGQPAFSNLTVPINAWAHIAVVRSGGTTTGYVNGTVAGSHTFTPAAVSAATIARYAAANPLYFPGYISNVRVVNGTAVYTGAFTPPSLAPLTNAGATSAVAYPSTTNVNTSFASSDTSLLTCQSNRFIDNSTNNFTITRNGDTRVVAFSPFNPTASWSAATNGGSGYFDGSGDMLATPSITIGASAFCFECWLYPTVTQGNSTGIFVGNTTNSLQASYFGTVGLGIAQKGVAWQVNNSDNVIPIVNQWNHVAFVRSGTGANQTSIYLNGKRIANGTVSYSYAASTYEISTTQAGGTVFQGYISSARLTVGSSPYDPSLSTLTVPTAPLTAITNTSLLLNFTNAGVYDATSKNDLETVGDAQISNTTAKWGSTSIKFDGTGDYLQMPDSELVEFGSADFTIEAWVYPTLLTGTNRIILGHGTSGTQWLAFYIDASGYLTFYAVSSSAVIDRTATSRAVSLNTWTHVAVSRSGSTFRLFIDGSEPTYTGSPSTTSSSMPNFAAPFRIGAQRWDGDSGIFQGYIQDMRITKYARYTANFTPPTAAFPTL